MIEQDFNDLKATAVEYGQLLFKEGYKYVVESSQQLAVGAVFYVGVCFVFYMGTAYLGKRSDKTIQDFKRVLVVTAHPDDECMFFGPLITKLTKKPSCHVYLLCLSTGNFAGIGSKRKQELWDSCRKLGIKDCNITLYKSERLPDDPSIKWQVDVLGDIILHHVESLDIDTLITFDKDGVSGHLNHSSLYYAAAYLFMEKKLPKSLRVFCLESTNVFRKYWSLLDLPLCYILSKHRVILSWRERASVQTAMHAHKSQMVWFRRLYIIFSRYLLVNTLQPMEQESLELDLALDE